MSVAIVSGMVAAVPGQGGATWAILQYLLGLRRLGFHTVLVEPVGRLDDDSVMRCRSVMARHGIDDWCLVAPDGTTAGMPRRRLDELAAASDLLVNVSGMLIQPALFEAIPTRVYLDLDPAFVQLWHAVEGIDMRLDGHTHFVTVSDAVGRTIPSCDRTWHPTLPPVVLEEWPYAEDTVHDAYTTVANWRGYGSIDHDGVHYGQKAHSLRPLFDLPARISDRILLALAIHEDERSDLEALRDNRWDLVEPAEVAGTPEAYREFVRGSRAEFGLTKSGYIVSDSGWFSDRSACYLASGRPVVAQDTGFGRRLPTGQGVFAFRDADEFSAAAATIAEDYELQRKAARAVAEEHLDSDIVLTAILREVLG